MEKTMTVDVYAISGDFVTCSDCGKVMLLPHGADKCPACKKEGCLAWTDDSLREADIDSLLERHCNLHQEKIRNRRSTFRLPYWRPNISRIWSESPRQPGRLSPCCLTPALFSRNIGATQDVSGQRISTRRLSMLCSTSSTGN